MLDLGIRLYSAVSKPENEVQIQKSCFFAHQRFYLVDLAIQSEVRNGPNEAPPSLHIRQSLVHFARYRRILFLELLQLAINRVDLVLE
jgi:hypothetical protein